MPHFMIILIQYINLLNLSWIKMSIFEEYGTFKIYTCTQCLSAINVYKITKPTLLLLIISPLNNVGIQF